MLRCHYCGAHAMAGLAHLHGLPFTLCLECTEKVMEKLQSTKCWECRKLSDKRLLHSTCTEFDTDEPSLRAA